MEANMKWHNGTGKWKDHWFVLRGSDATAELVYYHHRPLGTGPEQQQPLGKVPLHDLRRVVPSTSDIPGWREEFQGRCLMIENADQKHYLVTDKRRDMVLWLKELTAIKNAQLRSGFSTNSPHDTASSPTATNAGTTKTTTTTATSSPSSTTASPIDASGERSKRSSASSASARNKRQALVLDKGFNLSSASQMDEGMNGSTLPSAQPKNSSSVQDAADSTAAAKREKDLNPSALRLRQLGERQKQISMRINLGVSPTSTSPDLVATATMTDDTGTDAASKRLHELELRAEERKKRVQELEAKRKSVLVGIQSGADSTSASTLQSSSHTIGRLVGAIKVMDTNIIHKPENRSAEPESSQNQSSAPTNQPNGLIEIPGMNAQKSTADDQKKDTYRAPASSASSATLTHMTKDRPMPPASRRKPTRVVRTPKNISTSEKATSAAHEAYQAPDVSDVSNLQSQSPNENLTRTIESHIAPPVNATDVNDQRVDLTTEPIQHSEQPNSENCEFDRPQPVSDTSTEVSATVGNTGQQLEQVLHSTETKKEAESLPHSDSVISDTDDIIQKRIKEIESKKNQMLERMRKRQQLQNESAKEADLSKDMTQPALHKIAEQPQEEKQGGTNKPTGLAPDDQKEAMKEMLKMLNKQKEERAEERARLKQLLEERKKNQKNSNEHDTPQPEPTTDSATHEESHKQKESEEELKKIKEEMRKIRNTIVLIDKESATLNERIAQMRIEERRERERKASEEQSQLEREMREKLIRDKAREILIQRHTALNSPRELHEHEQYIIEKTSQNAVLVNLSGILLGRGRSHGNWFVHELGRTTVSPTTCNVEALNDDTIVRLKGGVVVRKPDGESPWELLSLPQNAIMRLSEVKDSTTAVQTKDSTGADNTDDSEQTNDNRDSNDGKKLALSAPDTSDLEDLEAEKKALLTDLRQAVNKIVEHFSQATSDEHMAALGNEAGDRNITRLVRGELSTIMANIFSLGFKSWKLFGSYCLWDYLEAFAQQSDSVGEIEALALRNAIKALNSNARMKENPHVKFRALICHGLNNKYLDEWVSLLLARKSLTDKWFNSEALLRHPTAQEAFIRSLVRLKNFPFAMDINYEVRSVIARTTSTAEGADSQTEQPLAASPSLGDSGSIEERMRKRGLSTVSAGRAAAAAAAAAQTLSNDISSLGNIWTMVSEKMEPKTPTEVPVTVAEPEGTTKITTVSTGGVKLWGALWGEETKTTNSFWGSSSRTSMSAEALSELKRKEEKRLGKERLHHEFVEGEDYESEVKVELVNDINLEIKEIDRRRSPSSVSVFFSSFLARASKDSDEEYSDERP